MIMGTSCFDAKLSRERTTQNDVLGRFELTMIHLKSISQLSSEVIFQVQPTLAAIHLPNCLQDSEGIVL